MSQYGLRLADVDSVTALELSVSYMKRQQFIAQQIALQFGKLLGGASEQAGRVSGQVTGDPLKPGRTSAGSLLGSLGFRPEMGINKVKH